MSTVVTPPQVQTQHAARGGRGAKRGNGNRNRAGRGRGGANTSSAPAGATPPSDGQVDTASKPAATADVQDDDEICFICADPVKYWAVSNCNHRTCHVCSLRLRALYKKNECTFCKEPQPSIVYTTSPDASYGSFELENMMFKDAKLAIYFETQEMMEETLLLLRFNCPDTDCDFIGNSWSDVKLHVRATHGRLMCDLCIRHKKVFAHEHALYPPNILPLHLPSASRHRNGKSKDKETEKDIEGGIHPLCEFCRECFFSSDELYPHMRETHEECFVCKRNGVRDQYFLNYPALETHFGDAHYPCTHATCQAQKFVVFGSELDLKAHSVEEHGGEMDKGGRRDARRVEPTWDGVAGGGRHGHGRNREHARDPPPAAPPQRPPGAGRRREGFGATLTVEGESTPAPSPTPTPPPPSRSDVDPATAERHASFLARMAQFAPNATTAVPAARAAIRSFRANESSARDLISTFWSILDAKREATTSVVNGLVDLLDDDEQREAVLAAWRAFDIEQRQQFPDLAVPTAVGSGYSGIASGRVLNAKHATAGRTGRSQVWDRVAQAAGSSSSANTKSSAPPFPVLGAGPARRFVPGAASRSTPWSTGGQSVPTGYAASSSFVPLTMQAPAPTIAPFSRTMNTGKSGPTPKLSNALFPELPPSAGARQKVSVRGNQSLKNIAGGSSAPAASVWGAGVTAEETAFASTEVPGSEGSVNGNAKKKGKGKGKQTLFTLGSFPS
ncbi:unnamed protein product [Mycena citricolor]|uniref:RING-type E3 ubiquitin transferase n=1 Tax=Mycena citricolor TaxID=2018698 RepID=A0AAD2HHX5_9AGAR|nr:unnamed protein product [Mycena citricolor]